MNKPKELTEEDKLRMLANNEHETFDKEQFDNVLKNLLFTKLDKPPKKNKI